MLNLLMIAVVGMFVLMALTGAAMVQAAAIGALLSLGAMFYLIRKAQESFAIGLPDQESSVGNALDEFLVREVDEALAYWDRLTAVLTTFGMEESVSFMKKDPDAGYAAYLSVRAGLRIGRVIGSTDKGIHILELPNGAIVHRTTVKLLGPTSGFIPRTANSAV